MELVRGEGVVALQSVVELVLHARFAEERPVQTGRAETQAEVYSKGGGRGWSDWGRGHGGQLEWGRLSSPGGARYDWCGVEGRKEGRGNYWRGVPAARGHRGTGVGLVMCSSGLGLGFF